MQPGAGWSIGSETAISLAPPSSMQSVEQIELPFNLSGGQKTITCIVPA